MKRYKLKILISILTSFLLINSFLFAAFNYIDTSARANGLSGGFVALADDISAILYNPAGLRQIPVKTVNLSYSVPYAGLPIEGLSLLGISYLHPVYQIGCFGFNFTHFSVADLYRESLLYINYSNKLNDFFDDLVTEIFTGINLKLFNLYYILDRETQQLVEYINDPVLTKSKGATAFSIDLGSIIRLGRVAYLGFSFINVIPANVGIYYEDIVPQIVRTGISFRKPTEESEVINKFNINCDISYRAQTWGELSDRFNFHTSAELYFKYLPLSLRAGISLDNFSLGASYLRNISKTRNMNLEIHYAFSLPFRLTDNYGNHTISLVYTFGTPIVEKKKEVIEEKIKIREELLEEIFKENTESNQLKPSQELNKEILKPTTETTTVSTEETPKETPEQQQQLTPQTTTQQTVQQPSQKTQTKKKKSDKADKKAKEKDIEEDIMKKLLELEKEGVQQQ